MAENRPTPASVADPRHERAQVLVETAIVFPVQLVITLAIMQYCLVVGARQVVTCAAHAAARAVLVGEDAHRAASIVCSPIAGSYPRPADCPASPILIPGRGHLHGSDRAQVKTFVDIQNPPHDDDPDAARDKTVTVTVTHHFELIIPFVQYTPFVDWHLLWGRVERLGPRRVVHKVMKETVSLPEPWGGDLEDALDHYHQPIPDLTEADTD